MRDLCMTVDGAASALVAEAEVQTAVMVLDLAECPKAARDRAAAILMAWAKGPVPT